MNHKLKSLGGILVAVLALGLAFTSAASAAKFTMASGVYPTTFEGSAAKGSGSFVTEAGTTECAGSGSGTLSEASSTATVTASFSECSSFGFGSTTVKTEGCYYLVHITGGSGDTYTANGDLVCPAGKALIGVSGTCEVQIPAQTGAVSGKLVNDTVNGKIEGNVTGSNISYTVTKDGFGCPYSGTGAKTGGQIKQSSAAFFGGPAKKVHVG